MVLGKQNSQPRNVENVLLGKPGRQIGEESLESWTSATET
jgi:hypothetical protein